MRDRDLYAKILGIQKPWTVSDVELNVADEEVEVRVEWKGPAAASCPECGEAAPRYDQRQRRWRHLDTCQFKTILVADVPRVQCPTHGVRQVQVPWSEPGSSFTALFEALVIDWLLEASISAVSRLLDLSWDQVAGIMERAVARGLARRGPIAPEAIGVDETSFQKRHEYVTVVTDIDESTVLHVADDRKAASLDRFYESLDSSALEKIEVVALDMWGPYISSTTAYVPDADEKIVFDKFHVTKLLTDAVDKVRRQENKALRAKGDDRLVRTKYLWLERRETMGDDVWFGSFADLRKSKLRTARAWAIKEASRELWHYLLRGPAERGWKKWLAWAGRSKLDPIKKAARTIRKYLVGVLNAVMSRVTNAISESTNAKIQKIKKLACGFRNRDRFRAAIYFHLGGLDLYPAGVAATHTDS